MQKALVQKNRFHQASIRAAGCWAFVLFHLAVPVFCQTAPVFEASTDARNIAVGSRFELVFKLRNAEGNHFRPPAMVDGVRVVGGPSQEQSMGFVNGQTFTQQAWRYELEALKPGILSIGPATVVAKGQTLRTKALEIRVSPARNVPDGIPGGNENVFVVGEISPKTLYVGQQASWQVKLYTLVGVDGADLVELPDFKGFYAKEKRRFDTRIQNATIKGKKYAVKTLYEEALFPQEAGELGIGTVKIRVGLERPGGGGAFWGTVPTVLESAPLSVKVLPLPQPVPANFSGGVGHYEWNLQVDKDTLTTDDALTVQVALKGNGDARRFAPPTFSMPVGLEVFDPKTITEEEYDNGEEIRHEQALEYAILPQKPGTYPLQPELTYFDVDSNRYVSLRPSAPILLRVGKGKNDQTDQASDLGLGNNPPEQTSILKRLTSNPLFWLALALPVLLLLFWQQRRPQPVLTSAPLPAKQPAAAVEAPQKIPTTPMPVPRKSPMDYFGEARQRLTTGDVRSFYGALRTGLQVFLETHFGLTPAQLNVPDIEQALKARRIDPMLTQATIDLWQRCEAAVYGGLIFQETPEAQLKEAEDLLENL